MFYRIKSIAIDVLSVITIDKSKVLSFRSVVAPGVLAINHQHISCLRIHLRIDGDGNTVIYEDSIRLPFETEKDKERNPKVRGIL